MTDMTKYVRLDDLIRSLYWESDNESWELPEDALERLQKSAVDAVPVVRCKDCKWFMPGQVCILRNVGVRNDFFCASGAMAILSGGGGGADD